MSAKDLGRRIRPGGDPRLSEERIDGLEDDHDWLRGVRTSFRRAIDGVWRASAAGLPFLDVVTCVNPRNLGHLDTLRDHVCIRAPSL